ncbi:MAG: hypothetical protein QOJ67_3792 [Acidimicrobiaceae bacterium]
MAMSILDGFEALGTETWLAVGSKRTEHPRVVEFHSSPHLDYRPHAAGSRSRKAARRREIDHRLGVENFHYPYSRHVLEITGSRPDLVLCNNLHGGFFDLGVLAWLSQQVPVVLRLADSWAFTGHCACPLGCSRWERGCGACPDLAIPPAVTRDATGTNWRRKQRIFSSARLYVVAPSRWMMDRANRSLLAPAIRGEQVVPNGVNLEVFKPGPRLRSRRRLGIDPQRKVLLYVANLGSRNPYKDFPTLLTAVKRLASGGGRALELLVVGGEGEDERLGENLKVRHLAYCDSDVRLADLYRAADLYVHAAREENSPVVVAEALACGTPAVVAAGGGTSEVVDHRRTGLVVSPENADALASALLLLLGDPALRERMGADGAASARKRFDRQRMVAHLHSWCHDVTARWRADRESDDRTEAVP